MSAIADASSAPLYRHAKGCTDDSAVCELAPGTEDAAGLGKPAVTAQAPGMEGALDVHASDVVADAALTVAVAICDGQGR